MCSSDLETEALACIGATEGISHLMWILLEPGDSCLVPDPTYPIHTYAPVLAGANVIRVPLSLDVDFFARLTESVNNTSPALLGSRPRNGAMRSMEEPNGRGDMYRRNPRPVTASLPMNVSNGKIARTPGT